MEPLLEVRDLHKSYGTVKAVDGVSLAIRPGICFGLLGPNGAGKTTTVEMIEGILEPDSGEMLFKGQPIGPHFKERIGIQFQSTALQQYITVRETLQMFSALYPQKRSFDEIVEICALQDLLDRDNQKLSGGQRQRMLLGLALVNDPELVFLDEPTTGLDPQARRNFWDLIDKIKGEGKTVVLTTHYMEEAEILCEEIAIMDHGKIVAQDAPKSLLRANFDGVLITVPYEGDPGLLPEGVKVNGGMLEIETKDIEGSLRKLIERDVSLKGLNVHAADLDDLFLKLTGTTLRS
ncbi:MAG: ABC transporter ATP-binding protein [Spirochaetales bacterium]